MGGRYPRSNLVGVEIPNVWNRWFPKTLAPAGRLPSLSMGVVMGVANSYVKLPAPLVESVPITPICTPPAVSSTRKVSHLFLQEG